jgi:hypothetical protein
VVGLLKQGTGGYAAGMQALALGLTLSATILLILGYAGKQGLGQARTLSETMP